MSILGRGVMVDNQIFYPLGNNQPSDNEIKRAVVNSFIDTFENIVKSYLFDVAKYKPKYDEFWAELEELESSVGEGSSKKHIWAASIRNGLDSPFYGRWVLAFNSYISSVDDELIFRGRGALKAVTDFWLKLINLMDSVNCLCVAEDVLKKLIFSCRLHAIDIELNKDDDGESLIRLGIDSITINKLNKKLRGIMSEYLNNKPK